MLRGRPRIAVIGGGITGLAAAYRLRAEAGAEVEVRVFERDMVAGGRIGSELRDGFLLEKGPDTFLARKPETAALAAELGLETELVSTVPENRRSYVARGTRLRRIPEGMSGLVPGRLGPLLRSDLLSWPGKLRAAMEPFVSAGREDGEETVAAFATRRFGREVYERLLEPLLCGIYAGDGERLSAVATVPQLVELERRHGSVLKGVRVGRKDAAGAGPGFLTFRGGMERLVRALLERVGDAVRYEAPAESLAREAGQWVVRARGERSEWDAVILAGPAWVGGQLLAGVDPTLAERLHAIEFASVAAVWCAFPAHAVPAMPTGYGYVIPRSEHREALACSWSDQKLAGRAPEGTRLFRVFIGRAGESIDDRAEDDLLVAARRELAHTLGVIAEPTVTRVIKHERSMPQYTLGHASRVAEIERLAAGHRGLHLAGNWKDGVGVSDCIRAGNDAAHSAWRGAAKASEAVRRA